MLERIVELLYQKGYRPLDSKDGGVLIRETDEIVYILALSTFRPELDAALYENAASRIIFNVATRYQKKVELLNLVATESGMFQEDAMQFVEKLHNVWFIAKDTGRIYIFENQPSQFDDLYEYLDNGIRDWKPEKNGFALTPVNMAIVALNVLCFILVIVLNGGYAATLDSDTMLRMGALSYDTFTSGKWYQIITSMFLHFGITHLFNNMILLIYAGCQLEQMVGKIRYLLLYMGSGIVGNAASLWYYHSIGEYAVSAGASGAIFGVIGALLVILAWNRTNNAETTPRRLFFLAFITIYYGMTTIGVDNAAHIGGLISGIFGGFLLSKVAQYGKLK
ncbi:MAG: rhomboid family intramembrane serine protease [Lachnospiraceae bacterium]|nr:rhomboid family intramembrane serine protease [Lachnospiraceae bacterium]